MRMAVYVLTQTTIARPSDAVTAILERA